MKRPSFRVKRNIWGNLNGYIGNRRVEEFGLDQQRAKCWLIVVQGAETLALRSAHDRETRNSFAEIEDGQPFSTQIVRV